MLDLDLREALVAEKSGHVPAVALPVLADAHDGIAHADASADDAAEDNAPEVIAVIEIRDEHLEIAHRGRGRRRDVLHDRLEKRLHVLAASR